MISAWIPFIVCIVGLAIYLFTKPEQAKFTRVGEIMFAIGLLVTLLHLPLPLIHGH